MRGALLCLFLSCVGVVHLQSISDLNSISGGQTVTLTSQTYTGAGNVGFSLNGGFTGVKTLQGSLEGDATIVDCEGNSRWWTAVGASGMFSFRDLVVRNCVTSEDGGAVYMRNWQSKIEFFNVTFEFNTALTGNGGALAYVVDDESSWPVPTLTSCTFDSNYAGNWDDAFEFCGLRPFYFALCGIMPADQDPFACGHNQTFDCSFGKGGGVYIESNSPVSDNFAITDTSFTRNHAHFEGGGLHLKALLGSPEVVFEGNFFSFNNCSASTNSIYDHPAGGGGLYLHTKTKNDERIDYRALVVGTVMTNNDASPCGGNALFEGNCPYIDQVQNNNGWSHAGGGIYVSCRKQFQHASSIHVTNTVSLNNTCASYNAIPDFLGLDFFEIEDDPFYGEEFMALPMIPRVVNGFPYMIYLAYGGAFFFNQSGEDFLVENNTMIGNFAWVGSGFCIFVDGGGIFAGVTEWTSLQPTASVDTVCSIINTIFLRNNGWLAGGGVFHDTGCITGVITNVTFADANTALFGGCFCYEFRHDLKIDGMVMTNCSNGLAGGGLWAGGACSGYMKNVDFTNCRSVSGAAAFFFLQGGTSILFDNTNFVDCFSTDTGGGLYVRSVLNTANVDGRRATVELSAVTITNSQFTDNVIADSGNLKPLFGAALYARDVNLHIEDCNFLRNKITGSGSLKGGAVFIQFVPNATIKNVQINGNAIFGGVSFPAMGGGLYGEDSDIFLNNVTVNDNSVTYLTEGDRAELLGGGIFMKGGPDNSVTQPARLLMEGFVEVRGNSVGREGITATRVLGGGIVLTDIAALVTAGQEVIIADNVAIGGPESLGGGIAIQLASTISIADVLIQNNTCSGKGGGIGFLGPNVINVTSSSLVDNTANEGGAVYGDLQAVVELLHCDVSRNTATLSGGAVHLATDEKIASLLIAVNTSFNDNTAEYRGLFYNRTSPVLATSIVEGNNFPNYYEVTNASTTTVQAELSVQEPGNLQNILIIARDSRGRAQTTGGDNFNFTFEYFADDTQLPEGDSKFASRQLGFVEINSTLIDNNEGTYNLLYTPTIAGNLRVSIFLNEVNLDFNSEEAVELGNSPLSQVITPGNPVSSETYVINPENFDNCKMCGECDVLVQLVDAFGNPWLESTGRLALEAIVTGVSNGELAPEDIGGGRMSVAWRQFAGGTHFMDITLQDNVNVRNSIKGSPFEYSPSWRTSHLCTSSTEVAMLILCVLSGGLLLIFLIFILINQTTWVIKASTPLFLILSLSGSIIAVLGTSFLLHYPEESFCTAHLWLFGTGFILMISPICAKNYRIMKIFGNKSLKVRVIPFKMLAGFVGGLLFVEWLFLAIWTGVDTPDLENFACGNFELCQVRCSYEAAPLGLWYAFHLVIALSQVYLAWATRKVSTEFNEMKSLGFSAYNITLTLSFLLAVLFTLEEDTSTYIALIICGQLVCVVFTMFALVAPKMYLIIRGKGNEEFFSTASRHTGSGSTGAGTTVE